MRQRLPALCRYQCRRGNGVSDAGGRAHSPKGTISCHQAGITLHQALHAEVGAEAGIADWEVLQAPLLLAFRPAFGR